MEDGRIEVFHKATQTVGGRPARLFLRSDLTEDLWLRQVGRETYLKRFQAKLVEKPRDSVAMTELAVELRESKYSVCTYPGCEHANWRQLQIGTRMLSVQDLQKLNSL